MGEGVSAQPAAGQGGPGQAPATEAERVRGADVRPRVRDGGARRSWLRGVVEVSKRYLMQVAGHNLGVIMRRLSGNGTPRSLQGACAALMAWIRAWWRPALPPECMRARVWSEPDTHAWQEARHYWWISTH